LFFGATYCAAHENVSRHKEAFNPFESVFARVANRPISVAAIERTSVASTTTGCSRWGAYDASS
jgi:hypothetical protein